MIKIDSEILIIDAHCEGCDSLKEGCNGYKAIIIRENSPQREVTYTHKTKIILNNKDTIVCRFNEEEFTKFSELAQLLYKE